MDEGDDEAEHDEDVNGTGGGVDVGFDWLAAAATAAAASDSIICCCDLADIGLLLLLLLLLWLVDEVESSSELGEHMPPNLFDLLLAAVGNGMVG